MDENYSWRKRYQRGYGEESASPALKKVLDSRKKRPYAIEPFVTPEKDHVISSVEALRAHYGTPSIIARDKVLAQLDEHCCRFITRSPFLILASVGPSGNMDASPRGDKAGFVQVRDAQTIMIPDRMGNKRVDSLQNIVTIPRVALLFLVPGVNETLRVNGTAEISIDPSLLERFKVRDRLPVSVIVVTVNEAFLHCAKALVRSALWNSSLEDRITPEDRAIIEKLSTPPVTIEDRAIVERSYQDYANTILKGSQ